MRPWLVALLLAPALIFSANPAAAGNGIRTTAEYRALKTYVAELNAEKDQKATPQQIRKYRSELSKRRAKTSSRVRAIYQGQVSTAKDRRAKRQQKVAKLKTQRDKQVATLKRALQNRLQQLEADRRAAIARINSDYADQTAALKKQRKQLRKQLRKAKTEAQRINLRAELQALQTKQDTLVRERQDDIEIANNKYDDLEQNTKSNYSGRIERTKVQANRNIAQQKQLSRELYAEAKQAAQERRAQNFSIEKALYERGVGYIKQMEPGPAPTPTPTP